MTVRTILRRQSMAALTVTVIAAFAAPQTFAAGKRERPSTRSTVTQSVPPARAGRVAAESNTKTIAARHNDSAARQAWASSADPPPQSRPARPQAMQTPPPPPPKYSAIANPRRPTTRPTPAPQAAPSAKRAPAQTSPQKPAVARTFEKRSAAKPVQKRQIRARANANIGYRRGY